MSRQGTPPGTHEVSAEQRVYAHWLDLGTKAGLAVLVIAFALYVLRVLPPHIPLEDLPRYWVLPVDRYLVATGLPSGWGWIGHVHKGDLLNFAAVALLAGVTLVCFVRLLFSYLRAGDRVYAALVVAEICVLTLAALGVAGH